jgi:hypothetical protein
MMSSGQSFQERIGKMIRVRESVAMIIDVGVCVLSTVFLWFVVDQGYRFSYFL